MPIPTFHTLKRQKESQEPSSQSAHYPKLASLPLPHIESFNAIFNHGVGNPGLMEYAVNELGRVVVFDKSGGSIASGAAKKIEFWFSGISVSKPTIESSKISKNVLVYPAECRERGMTYRGKIQAKFCWRVNDAEVQSEIKTLGHLPVIVRSAKCNLEGKSPLELVERREDPEEFGGYFIINGIERLVRLLIVPRRNHVLALIRPSFMKRGPLYTHFGVQIRSVRPDQSSQTCVLHYCRDGAVNFRFSYRKQEYIIPVMLILRSLKDSATDLDIFENLTAGDAVKDTFLTDRVELLLRSVKRYGLRNKKMTLAYLGSKFHVMLDSPEDCTEEQVGIELIKSVVLVHLNSNKEKFDMLIYMIRKLYALVSGDCAADNPDSPQHQEILLGGHLYLNYMKEKIGDILSNLKLQILQDIRRTPSSVDFQDRKYVLKALTKVNSDVGKKMEYFLATGNLVSKTGLDLQQTSGYTIVAEKLNFYRYISHFRSVHRGSFFAELKTTTVRKLLPEAWGFLCPVHTPDGSPCGLLNHLSHSCKIITSPLEVQSLPALLLSLGVSPMLKPPTPSAPSASTDNDVKVSKLRNHIMSVQLDGRIIGWCNPKTAEKVAQTLRLWKVKKEKGIPLDLEIGFVPPSNGGQYPGLYLFSTVARMMRPVKYLATEGTDMVGTFEQVYMDVACMNEDIVPGITTHIEFSPTNILSVVANLTPFSDFNQSPRNMYQCQMGKQSMGTPAVNLPHRTDNKMYRLQTGQTPVVRPKLHDAYGADGYPNGMNAVVCVISYTGYDMEDASIINKSSHERGYGHGIVYKSEFIDLSDKRRRGEPITTYFGLVSSNEGQQMPKTKFDQLCEFLDFDGLPHIGIRLKTGDPMYAYVDDVTGKVSIQKYKGTEDAYIEEVRVIGSDSGNDPLQKVHIKYRIVRQPVIGDKFSSRHGQKGVISQKWPLIDMPFTESGIVPDVIINPHAFPSRMTIGMFVESLAGKAGALHGCAQDATPFTFNESFPASDFFGEQLKAAGYNYYGNEPMYSGITGEEFKADIYIGVVYYQRLRHMVSDKYQVRTTGPVHDLTQQPVKGRKRNGGIRLGEMERDSLLAHGVSFCLQDRLLNCSDYSQAHVCVKCGSILSSLSMPAKSTNSIVTEGSRRNQVGCKLCGDNKSIDVIAIPYVFRYLCTELAAMNVKLKLEF